MEGRRRVFFGKPGGIIALGIQAGEAAGILEARFIAVWRPMLFQWRTCPADRLADERIVSANPGEKMPRGPTAPSLTI